MRTLTSIVPFHPVLTDVVDLLRDQPRHEAHPAWTIPPGAVPTPVFNDLTVHDLAHDRSLCLFRLTFRPFHPQPPHCHFVSVDFARYVIAETCCVYPPGRPIRSKGSPSRSKGSPFTSRLPDRLGRIRFTFVTDWSFVSGCSPPCVATTQLPLSTTGG